MKSIRYDLFGRDILIVDKGDGWQVFYLGSEGKRRLARDLTVPSNVAEPDLTRYLDDLCHEWATDRHPKVRRID